MSTRPVVEPTAPSAGPITPRSASDRNRARVRVPATAPRAVFDFITDVGRLPSWNASIEQIVERPDELTPGATWKAAMRDGAMRWVSRSEVVRHDPVAMVFAHRSGTDDSNPSYAEWQWSVWADGADSIVEASWRLHPKTALRRWLLAPYRSRRLRHEVPTSLAALVHALDDATPAHPGMHFDAATTLLGVWAHPDDEAYLSAALMHRVRRAGGRVVVAMATLGEAGLPALDAASARETRSRELTDALASLGVADLRLLGHEDGRCEEVDDEQASAGIEALIREVRPDLVVTFGPDGITGHPDHRAVSRWTTAAWRRAGHGRLLFATMTDQFLEDHRDTHEAIGLSIGPELQSVPDAELALHVQPTGAERDAKRRALDAHRSQTVALSRQLGYEAFHGWWAAECFRDPTPSELASPTLTPSGVHR